MEFLQQLDTHLFLFLNGMHSPFFDRLFYTITKPLISLPVYLFIIFLLFKKFNSKQALFLLLILITVVGLADFISVHCFKNVFLRYRPSHNLLLEDVIHLVREKKGGLYGFVSSHASNTFAFAMFSTLIFRKKNIGVGLFVWAIIVSYSRIYLGLHYPADILGGAILGCFIAVTIFLIVKKYFSKLIVSQSKNL